MNFDDIIELVVLLYFVGRWVRNAVVGRRASKAPEPEARAERRGAEDPSTPEPAEGGARPPQGLVQNLLDAASALAEAAEAVDPAETGPDEPIFEPLLRRASLLRGRAGQILAEGGRRPDFEPVRRAVERHLLPELEALRDRLGAAELRLADGTVTEEDWGLVEDADVRLMDVASGLSHLATWWRMRRPVGAEAFLADADRLARGLLADMSAFATRRGLDLTDVLPLSVFGEADLAQARRFADTDCAPFPLPEGPSFLSRRDTDLVRRHTAHFPAHRPRTAGSGM